MDTHEYEESCQLKILRKLNNHDGSQRVLRIKHHPLVIYTPLFIQAKGFSPWLLSQGIREIN